MYASNSTSSSRKRPVERASPIIKRGTTKKTKLNFAQHSPSAPLTDSNDLKRLENLPFFHDLVASDQDHSLIKTVGTSVTHQCSQTDNTIANDFINNILKKDSKCFHYTGLPTVALLSWFF
ncbi:hypothetical protein DPMN_049931 [Dreissena polymorpha]|uniref:Uncharacterized protein n=1 Tax=Dreissena polymorpha TaxID=45954 RepID=A0A9D4HMJ8_DREPO|nr:hypothetical protein DPMN_049931 [Dreissena polymorpha]